MSDKINEENDCFMTKGLKEASGVKEMLGP